VWLIRIFWWACVLVAIYVVSGFTYFVYGFYKVPSCTGCGEGAGLTVFFAFFAAAGVISLAYTFAPRLGPRERLFGCALVFLGPLAYLFYLLLGSPGGT